MMGLDILPGTNPLSARWQVQSARPWFIVVVAGAVWLEFVVNVSHWSPPTLHKLTRACVSVIIKMWMVIWQTNLVCDMPLWAKQG